MQLIPIPIPKATVLTASDDSSEARALCTLQSTPLAEWEPVGRHLFLLASSPPAILSSVLPARVCEESQETNQGIEDLEHDWELELNFIKVQRI